MSIVFPIVKVLYWIGLVILGIFIFVETIIRLVKHFIHVPSPPCVPYLINNPIRRKFWPPTRVIDYLDVREGMKILEVGPGSGFYTFELSGYAGPSGHVYAVDIEPKMIHVLEKKIKREGTHNITPRVASAYEVPLPDNTIDMVFLGGVIGEIPDKRRALREMQRVLREGGLIAVIECLIDPDYPRRKTVFHWFEDAGFEIAGSYGNSFLYILTFTLKSKIMS